MSRTWALRPGEYARGPRVVSTTLRPVRPAVLIPDDDPGMAARFAWSRSLAWGGHTCYALPFSRSEGLREPWRRLLDVLDPDQVYALGISRPRGATSGVVDMHAPRREPPKPLVDRMGDGLGRMLYTAEGGPERMYTGASALMHSVLRAVGENLKPPGSERFVVAPRVQRGHYSPAYLPLVARYGGVDDAEVERYLNGAHSHRWRFDLDLSRLVRIEEMGDAGDLLGMLAGDLSSLFEEGEEARADAAGAHPGGSRDRVPRHPLRRPVEAAGRARRHPTPPGNRDGCPRQRRGLRTLLDPQVRTPSCQSLPAVDPHRPPRGRGNAGDDRGSPQAF